MVGTSLDVTSVSRCPEADTVNIIAVCDSNFSIWCR